MPPHQLTHAFRLLERDLISKPERASLEPSAANVQQGHAARDVVGLGGAAGEGPPPLPRIPPVDALPPPEPPIAPVLEPPAEQGALDEPIAVAIVDAVDIDAADIADATIPPWYAVGPWSCAHCTFTNTPMYLACAVCANLQGTNP